jgi:taurine dioxygenase
MAYQHIDVRPIAGALGAQVSGVDLADPSEDSIGEIRRALLRHLVLRFDDQHLNPDQHKALGRRFGKLVIHPHYLPLEGHPEILPVLKEKVATENIGGVWHSDVSFLERPAMGALLYALDVLPWGGDTLFANQYLAYDHLSDGMKRLLGRLSAVHSDATLSRTENKLSQNRSRSTKLREDVEVREVEHEHPVVRTHPETGRKLLFVNRPFTVRLKGMTEAESRPLLEFLFQHAARPEFTCRIRWAKHTLVFWDNRAVQHYALNDYQGHRREMHRVTVEGDRPV